jgi:putative addiction module component (TIGR02574 family)
MLFARRPAMGNPVLDRLRSAVLNLPEPDRAELAHELVRSLDGPPDPSAAAAWEEEIKRRVDELDAGTARTIDRAEFSRRLRE